jgi:hypothetical protein
VRCKQCSIQHNTIYATGRSAIYPDSNFPIDNLDISYNNLYNTMMLSRDGGAIYAPGSKVTGAVIHHNWIHDSQSLLSGPASNYATSGVYLDEDGGGWEVYQNVLWNNGYYNIFIHGSTSGAERPDNNKVYSNTIPDVAPHAYIWLQDVDYCGTTQVINNKVLINVVQTRSACTVNNNNSTALGANEMTSTVSVGCEFAGCSTPPPPAVSGDLVAASIIFQPNTMTIRAGTSATFRVTAAGSGKLNYQWQKNGVTIPGAIGSSYTIPATTSAENGTVFSVTVSNSVGSIKSNAATLWVD